MAERPNDDAPVLNIMLEDYLAHGATEADHELLLRAWLVLGAEAMARTCGRGRAINHLHGLSEFIRDAQPARPWRP